jgi:hypothetical protein
MICLKYLLLVVVALVDVGTVGRLVAATKKRLSQHFFILVVVGSVDVVTWAIDVGRLVRVVGPAEKSVTPTFFHTCRGRLCRCSSLGG